MNNLDSNKVLLTGATGLLGSRMLRLLIEKSECEINLLIRGASESEVDEKVRGLLGRIFVNERSFKRARIKVYRGDVSKKNLGLSQRSIKYLTKNVKQIYHCAASTSFTESLEEVRRINLSGTKNILNFAKNSKGVDSLEYISTVFVAGDYSGVFSEKDLDKGQGFNNCYEQSKWEVEKFILEKNVDYQFKVRIYRPGVIVGDYPSGQVLNPGLLYKLFRLLMMRTVSCIPLDLDARLNVIPANIAAEIIYLIASRGSVSQTYHLLMPENQKVSELIIFVCSLFDIVAPRIVSFRKFEEFPSSAVLNKFLAPFLPYFRFRAKINSKKTFDDLCSFGFYFPELDRKYFRNLFDFYRKNWHLI